MPRGNAKIPLNLLINKSDIEPMNKKWVYEFNESNQLSKSYLNQINNLLRLVDFENKQFKEYTEEDISRFIEILRESGYKPRSTDSLISILVNFRNFLTRKYPLDFKENFLLDLEKLKDSNIQDEKNFKEYILNLEQLSAIRAYNNKEGIKSEYIFEIFFQLGLDKGKYFLCNPHNADLINNEFVCNNTKIQYNEKIHDLLVQIEEVEGIKWNLYEIQKYFSNITVEIRKYGYSYPRDLCITDIKKCHDRYFFQCPNCGIFQENISENWILAAADIGNGKDEYHLVCKICKGKYSENNYN